MAIGQFVWGASQPIFGAIADQYGAGRVLILGGFLLARQALTPLMTSEWGLILTLGILTAAGAGAGSFSILIGAAARRLAAEQRRWPPALSMPAARSGSSCSRRWCRLITASAGSLDAHAGGRDAVDVAARLAAAPRDAGRRRRAPPRARPRSVARSRCGSRCAIRSYCTCTRVSSPAASTSRSSSRTCPARSAVRPVAAVGGRARTDRPLQHRRQPRRGLAGLALPDEEPARAACTRAAGDHHHLPAVAEDAAHVLHFRGGIGLHVARHRPADRRPREQAVGAALPWARCSGSPCCRTTSAASSAPGSVG